MEVDVKKGLMVMKPGWLFLYGATRANDQRAFHFQQTEQQQNKSPNGRDVSNLATIEVNIS